ncbi:MAG: RCC1 domain-containing protein, partial [Gemmatimonadota bacterium]
VGDVAFEQITAGDVHSCGLAQDGAAYCWGWNAFFQRGNSLDLRDAEPVPVSGGRRFIGISAGAHHTCALGVDSLAYCWGYNRYGQLGNESTATMSAPTPVQGGLKFRQLSAGSWHTCAVTRAGEPYCWGRNEVGQLGIGSGVVIATVPTVVAANVAFSQIDGGETHTCAVAMNNDLYCWGSSEHGELGDGSAFKPGLAGATTPVRTSNILPRGSAISAGAGHTCALDTSSQPWCWGSGEFGQLAIGSTQDHHHPQPVMLFRQRLNVSALAAGGATHACALIEERVFCWGTGQSGQLGVANSTFAGIPQQVAD